MYRVPGIPKLVLDFPASSIVNNQFESREYAIRVLGRAPTRFAASQMNPPHVSQGVQ
jgi:hypothetical protein